MCLVHLVNIAYFSLINVSYEKNELKKCFIYKNHHIDSIDKIRSICMFLFMIHDVEIYK